MLFKKTIFVILFQLKFSVRAKFVKQYQHSVLFFGLLFNLWSSGPQFCLNCVLIQKEKVYALFEFYLAQHDILSNCRDGQFLVQN